MGCRLRLASPRLALCLRPPCARRTRETGGDGASSRLRQWNAAAALPSVSVLAWTVGSGLVPPLHTANGNHASFWSPRWRDGTVLSQPSSHVALLGTLTHVGFLEGASLSARTAAERRTVHGGLMRPPRTHVQRHVGCPSVVGRVFSVLAWCTGPGRWGTRLAWRERGSGKGPAPGVRADCAPLAMALSRCGYNYCANKNTVQHGEVLFFAVQLYVKRIRTDYSHRIVAAMSHPWHQETRGPPGPMTDATSCGTAGSQPTACPARERGRL